MPNAYVQVAATLGSMGSNVLTKITPNIHFPVATQAGSLLLCICSASMQDGSELNTSVPTFPAAPSTPGFVWTLAGYCGVEADDVVIGQTAGDPEVSVISLT